MKITEKHSFSYMWQVYLKHVFWAPYLLKFDLSITNLPYLFEIKLSEPIIFQMKEK